jgi:hypothetical protein
VARAALVLGDGVQVPRGLRDFIFLQKAKRLLQARIAFGGALRDRSDRRADGLLAPGAAAGFFSSSNLVKAAIWASFWPSCSAKGF